MQVALAERDYFTDHSILRDPYAYFEALRAHGPVYRLPGTDIVAVTGFEETLAVLRDAEHYSSSIALPGPAAPLPFEPVGDDLTELIEAHRAQIMGGDLVVTYDDQRHAMTRALLNRLFTPSRLKANEAFITDYAERMVDEVVSRGHCEIVRDIAVPFVTMVVADLLGVPEGDRQIFMDAIEQGDGAGSLDSGSQPAANHPLVIMGSYFAQYMAPRRAQPTGDVMSELAVATYPDGSLPDLLEVVKLATFLFAAGQDTSAKLIGNALKFICDEPGLQDRLRADPSLVPALIEEVLRLEGSTKMTTRLVRRPTTLAGMELAPGDRIFVALAAANRDVRRWDDPATLKLDRPKAKEHLAFGRGAHVCAGAPLARVEVRVVLEKLLEKTTSIEIDAEQHGPPGNRHLEYEPSFIIRGLETLHLKLTPRR